LFAKQDSLRRVSPKYASDYPIFYVTVDVVLFAIAGGVLHTLVVERAEEPTGWALPGGFVEPEEDLRAAAERELAEETGVRPGDLPLEQLATYGAPDRDTRYLKPPAHARVVSVAWLSVLPELVEPQAGTDAADAVWRPVDRILADGLAFDHDQILGDAVARLQAKLHYTPVATAFLGGEFSLAELREIYEVVWGRELDPGNFQRKVRLADRIVEPTGRLRSSGRGRPAELFRPTVRAADVWRIN
jgi:8-oxo-dGTP diphosphatase